MMEEGSGASIAAGVKNGMDDDDAELVGDEVADPGGLGGPWEGSDELVEG